jgi:hypothetical protein
MTPLLIAKLVGIGVMGLLVFASVSTIDGWRRDAAEYKGKYEEAQATATATNTISGSLDTALADEGHQEDQVSTARHASEARFEELKNEDTNVGTWAAQPIPARLRAEERARRLALHGPEADADRGEAPDGKAAD